MDWPERDRVLALLGFCVFYVMVAAISFAAFAYTAAHFVDLEVARLAFWVSVGLGVLWTGLIAFGLVARRRGWPQRPLQWLLALSFGLYSVLCLYVVGLYATPLWLLLATGLMLAHLLLDRVIVHTSALVTAVALTLLSAGEYSGLLPHAPLFTAPPYTAAGYQEPVWHAAMALASWFLILIGWVIGDNLMTRWREREESVKKLSIIDPLTGLANRRHFMDSLRRECRRAERGGRPVSLLMLDADHFKRINDGFGHAVGDDVLMGLAQVLVDGVREFTDLVGRFGGEEFAVLLPDADIAAATAVAERIRAEAAARTFEVEGATFAVTLSVGAVSSETIGADPSALLHAADMRLYRSKREGRNRVTASDAA